MFSLSRGRKNPTSNTLYQHISMRLWSTGDACPVHGRRGCGPRAMRAQSTGDACPVRRRRVPSPRCQQLQAKKKTVKDRLSKTKTGPPHSSANALCAIRNISFYLDSPHSTDASSPSSSNASSISLSISRTLRKFCLRFFSAQSI